MTKHIHDLYPFIDIDPLPPATATLLGTHDAWIMLTAATCVLERCHCNLTSSGPQNDLHSIPMRADKVLSAACKQLYSTALHVRYEAARTLDHSQYCVATDPEGG